MRARRYSLAEPQCVDYKCRHKHDASFVMAFECQSDNENGEICGHVYDVECILVDGKWQPTGSTDCPKCKGADNPWNVVCEYCRSDAPEYCRECNSYGCCCPDPDIEWEQREENRLLRDKD